MNMTHFTETLISPQTESGGQSSFDNRPFSRNFNQQTTSIHTNSYFKKPSFFSEKNSLPNMPLSPTRPKPYIPYKSQPRFQFSRGRCHFGENCHFSHGMSEIRKHPWFAMRERAYFSSGRYCPFGEKCHFPHKCDQKVWRGKGGCAVNGGERYFKKMFVRKTELCRNWEKFGSCAYGVQCVYAHGKAELQEQRSLAATKYGYSPRLMISTRPNNAALHEVGTNTANKLQPKGKSSFIDWEIEKIGQIYADWIDR